MCVSSDLPGYDPTTLNEMILYYHLMTKLSVLGDSTKLSWMGLSQPQVAWYGASTEDVAAVVGRGLTNVPRLVARKHRDSLHLSPPQCPYSR
jgi:hypothetical protein